MATGRVHLPAHAAALSRARVHPAAYVTTFHRMRWHSVEARAKMRDAALLLTSCALLCVLLSSSQAARPGQDMRCGACRALVDEMEWAISQIDPKKMIQTGSFRINPDGSQSIREVPLARSEGNLLELMESVCERMEDYGEHTDPSTNRKSYIRVKSRSGEAMDLSEATLDSRVTASLKFACETIVEHN
ncbi:Protein canopy-like protein 2 [Larimichthys crocea]|uniref:Uncharacterized protein n=1 Tax=Larimichthys crocea TaxID=215358 RepID=A0ACD3RJF8_LARCR|nr:Protein canopy-like protein 2 [Larimichthys crocea]